MIYDGAPIQRRPDKRHIRNPSSKDIPKNRKNRDAVGVSINLEVSSAQRLENLARSIFDVASQECVVLRRSNSDLEPVDQNHHITLVSLSKVKKRITKQPRSSYKTRCILEQLEGIQSDRSMPDSLNIVGFRWMGGNGQVGNSQGTALTAEFEENEQVNELLKSLDDIYKASGINRVTTAPDLLHVKFAKLITGVIHSLEAQDHIRTAITDSAMGILNDEASIEVKLGSLSVFSEN